MTIDYSAFEKAIRQFEKSVGFYRSDMAEENDDLKEQFRGAVIQAFEYTYELAYKMIVRQLGQIVPNRAILKEMSFLDLIRTAREAGLVKEIANYREFREKRNITSHTYDENKAFEIISVIDSFLEEMHHLIDELKKRNIEQ
jgi:nucleotidyltransferase substrate binding protein (TIGR01987 family)